MGFFDDLKQEFKTADKENKENGLESLQKEVEISKESVVVEDEEPVKEEAVQVIEPERFVVDEVINTDPTEDETETTMAINERRVAIDETSIITSAMNVMGDIVSNGSLDVIGSVNGNIEILGRLNVTGYINGNSSAPEIHAEGAKINGEVVSGGAIKIGAKTVIVGNISATSAMIAGAVKGDIDVCGPVVLDASAVVMGNIKSKSVQINSGAVIEGMCSQCYADVDPGSFFVDCM